MVTDIDLLLQAKNHSRRFTLRSSTQTVMVGRHIPKAGAFTHQFVFTVLVSPYMDSFNNILVPENDNKNQITLTLFRIKICMVRTNLEYHTVNQNP